MSYLVLARKYRPQDFSSVSGQEHVTRTLANAIKKGKVSHAYLFAGPRGVGKTSIARILSKALNCAKGPTTEPCLKCANCIEIAQGNSLAVREIDGASHNSVDNVRELIDSFRALPAPGSRYKIYIIDEVHMLSTAAFNALLKSLEEPPPHTVFILATTEPHKIPDTVISRCQRHDLRAIEGDNIEKCLLKVAASEKIEIAPEALRMVARFADGSMRDAHSILDRLQSFCDDKITAADVGQMLGSVERSVLFELSASVFSRSADKALSVLNRAFQSGIDVGLFLREFAIHFRDLLVVKFGNKDVAHALHISEQDLTEIQRQVASVDPLDLQDLVQLAREGADIALRSNFPKYALEALMVRMCSRESVKTIAQLIAAGGSGAGFITPASLPSSSSPVETRKSHPQASDLPSSVRQARASLNWAEFVRFVSDKFGKMVSEQLKRLEVIEFSSGLLKASGPDFCVKYLKGAENATKLKLALKEYSSVADWKLDLNIVAESSGAGRNSLTAQENEQAQQKSRAEKEDLSQHPKIRSLQKLFPGSKIENIVTKE